MNPVQISKDRLRSIDELDHDIFTLAARINSSTYELLVLVRQFDERAEWLHWRCDLSMSAAREKVRTANYRIPRSGH